jgi:hypothetical protein
MVFIVVIELVCIVRKISGTNYENKLIDYSFIF